MRESQSWRPSKLHFQVAKWPSPCEEVTRNMMDGEKGAPVGGGAGIVRDLEELEKHAYTNTKIKRKKKGTQASAREAEEHRAVSKQKGNRISFGIHLLTCRTGAGNR